jgi:hypothetical protein
MIAGRNVKLVLRWSDGSALRPRAGPRIVTAA